MSRFSKELRQEIVREFSIRHNGTYNPTLFVDEVRAKGPSHPAYDWFEWDNEKAARQWQIEQAREFARDLRVFFSIEEVGRSGKVTVRTGTLPMVMSPIANRASGGGYLLVDADEPAAYIVEHCQQAALALRGWLSRYRAAIEASGLSAAAIDETVQQLERVSADAAAAA